jgi:CheY-like chemotaxis protein
MGGSINIASTPGVGSTFSFTVSFARATIPGSKRESVRGARVLIVDDDPIARDIVLRYTHSWGMQADASVDALAGLAALTRADERGEPYNVAIVDMRMAGMNGLAFGEALRSDPRTREMPLILITAFDDHAIAEEAKRIGFARYLLKPIRQSQLYDAIADALQTRMNTSEPALAEQVREKIVHPHQILLVEDNPVNARLALKQLERLGFAATSVSNGSEALDAMTKTLYDLVLMDCHMPVMDGFEATAKIRKNELRTHRHVPIVAMTASARTEDRDACLAAGMDDYLAKPVAIADIQRIVGTWLSTYAI